jgi:hypothetical protein
MKRIVTLLISALLLPFLGALSCDPLCDTKAIYFDINGLEFRNWTVSQTLLPDGKFSRQAEEGDTVAWSAHYMRAVFEVSYYSQRKESGVSPGGAAFALTCRDHFISEERHDTLYVITRNAWDRTHPAGDTINDLIDLTQSHIGEAWQLRRFEPLAEWVVRSSDKISFQTFAVRVDREPEFKTTPHAFRLVYRMRDGEVYTAETGSVWLK